MKIVQALAEIQGQMSFKLHYTYVKIAEYENSDICEKSNV